MNDITRRPGAALASPLVPGALSRASTDEQLVALWLRRPNLSPQTVRAAAKEAKRFLMWCAVQQLELRTVAYEHLLGYAEFLTAPSPTDQWIAPAKYPRGDPDWRPFLGPLSPSSQRQALIIIKGLFSWAQAAGYLRDNPARLLGPMPMDVEDKVTRFLPQAAMPYLLQAVDRLPNATPAEQLRQARARFVLLAYYYSAARLAELASADMRNFRRDQNGRWWLHVLGKGSKRGQIPVADALLYAFRQYRTALGLSALPPHDEALPLILASHGPQRRASQHTVARIIKKVVGIATKVAQVDGQHELAGQIEQASTHWLRHTSLSHQADAGVPLKTLQANARHANIKTTGRYLHNEDAKRHSETNAWAKHNPLKNHGDS